MLWATFRTCSRPRLISLPLQGFHDFAEFASGMGTVESSIRWYWRATRKMYSYRWMSQWTESELDAVSCYCLKLPMFIHR
jgi:hypothetical protein